MKEELKLFKALSDETRLRIMMLLSRRELCVCQLEWALELSQVKVSRHLTILKNSGLAQDRREGLWIFYSLTKPKNELEQIIHKYLKECFTKKHNLFKKDINNMQKCLNKPLGKLSSIKEVKKYA